MKVFDNKHIAYLAFTFVLLFLTGLTSNAQTAISVYTSQNISFGTFYQGNSGGTISISSDGQRTSTGDVVLLNTAANYFPAIFEVEAPAGTVISISKGPDVSLKGSNGGTMTLHIGDADTGSSFITTAAPPERTKIKIGGILTVGNQLESPAGTYSGTISVTFIQE